MALLCVGLREQCVSPFGLEFAGGDLRAKHPHNTKVFPVIQKLVPIVQKLSPVVQKVSPVDVPNEMNGL